MNNSYLHIDSHSQKKFLFLKQTSTQQKETDLARRLSENAIMTDMEYSLGAFLDMYEPYLIDIVKNLFGKGYLVETSSGFGTSVPEYQMLIGNFNIDYISKNKIEKFGVKIREHDGGKALVFLADQPDLEYIKLQWMNIITQLPDKGIVDSPSERPFAKSFRLKYDSNNPKLQKIKVFENFKLKIGKKIEEEFLIRLKNNPHPTNIECCLGIFIEELEPYVRDAIVVMNKKGYSTDASGFISGSCDQMIEGDFTLAESAQVKLEELGIFIESNPSGYTRLKFTPEEADLKKIRSKWNIIALILPQKDKAVEFSMTRNAREFRNKYSSS